jgi:hypothetical protein
LQGLGGIIVRSHIGGSWEADIEIEKIPAPFLAIRVEAHELVPPLTAACAGYELKRWRAEQLAAHLLEWLPEFALRYSEWKTLGAHNALTLLAKAAYAVYTSDKYSSRGEIGELILHVILRQHFKSKPAISKYFYKDASNDTVKGFDAVHVVPIEDGKLELWLGEVKFYKDISSAIDAAIDELKKHTERQYLRSEFSAICNKIDDEWPAAKQLRELISNNNSLDKIFSAICIPILLTYESDAVRGHKSVTAAFEKALQHEVREHHATFVHKAGVSDLKVRLLLFPMDRKSDLTEALDKRLKALQHTVA